MQQCHLHSTTWFIFSVYICDMTAPPANAMLVFLLQHNKHVAPGNVMLTCEKDSKNKHISDRECCGRVNLIFF